MTEAPDDTPSAIQAIWDRHHARAIAEVERISGGDRDDALRAAHHLAGSLGVFGFAEGSRLAKECERALLAGTEPAADVLARLRVVVQDGAA